MAKLFGRSVCVALLLNCVTLGSVVLITGGLVSASAQAAEKGFKQLFDGKSLAGWEGNEDCFRVEDGSIVAGTLKEKIPHNEFLATEQQYSNFELRLDVKLVGAGENAGVQFRSKRVEGSTEVEGYQADAGQAWDRPVWGALYDESRRRKMLAEGPKEKLVGWVKQGDWNELRIVAVDEHISLYLNGHLTVNYTEEDDAIARSGIIALQIHSGPPSEAWYRNIRVRKIGKVEALRRQKIAILTKLVEWRTASSENGTLDVVQVLAAKKDLLRAKLELAETTDQKQSILREMIDCQSDVVDIAQARHGVAASGAENALSAKVELIDLQVQLEQLGN